MSSEAFENRGQVFDGASFRDIWLPGDGPGDGDVDLVADGHTRKSGHPTWKIFASDMPGGPQRTGNSPPRRVYLDDKACYEVLTSGAFSGNMMGKCWPYDFTTTGRVRFNRPNRGRPAYFDNGMVATGFRTNGNYVFCGNAKGVNGGQSTPVAEAGSVHDDRLESLASNMDHSEEGGQAGADEADASMEDVDADADNVEADNPLLSKQLEELTPEELEELRQQYTVATQDAEDAHVRAARLHHQSSRAELERASAMDERDKLQGKLQETMERLKTKHRDNVELDLAMKRLKQDALVTKRMLEKTKEELRELKDAHTVLRVRAEAADGTTDARLREEHSALLELCKTLYVGHTGSKSISEDVTDKSAEGLAESVRLFEETQRVVDEGISAIRGDMESKGLGQLLRDLMGDGDLGE